MTLIIDAGVALKWVLDEEGSEAARALVTDEILAAPDLLFIECANVLRVKARRGDFSEADARNAYAAIAATPIRLIATELYVAQAQSIAFDLDQTAYDCLYLAVALAEHATLISADITFIKAAAAHPLYRASIRALER